MNKKILPFLLLAVACTKTFKINEPAVEQAVQEVACNQSESRFYDVLYKSLEQYQHIPELEDARTAILKEVTRQFGDNQKSQNLARAISEFYRIILDVSPHQEKGAFLEFVTSLEVGDKTVALKKETLLKLEANQKEIQNSVKEMSLECPSLPPTDQQEPAISTSSATDLVLGAKAIMATAYQSCSSLTKPPLTTSTSGVQGISVVGRHADGVGLKRSISSLSALVKSHYYLKDLQTTAQCFDSTKDPLIYDYGGKPYASADDNSLIDLFKNAGSGTDVMGIDCSAFIFSSIATAGLKLHPDKKMKAILVNGVSSTMFVDPQKNGLVCFDKAKLGKSGTLQLGDIVAIPGHVVMIDQVSSDPLGILKVKAKSDCSQLTSSSFDFIISQSSPSKSGIGINRFIGKDYLASAPTFKAAFETVARQICEARFNNQDIQIDSGKIQIARYTGNLKCQNPRIKLVAEECAQSCR